MPLSSELSVFARRGTQETGGLTSGVGLLHWTTSSDHTTLVSHYEAKVYAQGSSTVIKIKYLGKPGTGNSVTTQANIAAWLSELPAGNYDVAVFAVNGEGSTASNVHSNTFTVPLTPEV